MRKLPQAEDLLARGGTAGSPMDTDLPSREFPHVDDLADGLNFVARNCSAADGHFSAGIGEEVSVLAFAEISPKWLA